MTDEERREAERLADKLQLYPSRVESEALRREAFFDGYAAACEAKQAEIKRLTDVVKNLEEWIISHRWVGQPDLALNAERARSAKLLEALKSYADYRDECDVAAQAIAEYEASK